jgi:hypothetical protein
VRTRSVDHALVAGLADGLSNGVTTVLPDGALLVQMAEPRGGTPQPTVYRPRIGFGVLSEDLSTYDTLGWYGDQERILLETTRGPRTMPVLNPHGSLYTLATHRPTVCVGDQASPRVSCWGWRGRDRVEFRWPAQPRILADHEAEALRDGFREGLGRRYTPEGQEQILRDLPLNEVAPYFDHLAIDGTDRLWVFSRDSTVNDPAMLISVFSSERGLEASLRGQSHDVLEIGSDYLLALERDELGVESVAVYPISRGQAR